MIGILLAQMIYWPVALIFIYASLPLWIMIIWALPAGILGAMIGARLQD